MAQAIMTTVRKQKMQALIRYFLNINYLTKSLYSVVAKLNWHILRSFTAVGISAYCLLPLSRRPIWEVASNLDTTNPYIFLTITGMFSILIFLYLVKPSSNSQKAILIIISTYFVSLICTIWPERVYDPMHIITILYFFIGLLVPVVAGSVKISEAIIAGFAAVQALWGIILYKSGHELMLSGEVARLRGPQGQMYDFDLLLSIGLPIICVLAITQKHKTKRLLLMFFACLTLSAMLLTWSRGTTTACSVVVLFLLFKSPFNYTIRRIGSCLAIVLPLIVISYRNWGVSNHVSALGSNSGHLHLINSAWHIFLSNWFVGVGPGRLIIPVSWNERLKNEVFYDPKNFYLYILVEFGVVGGCCLGVFIINIVSTIRRSYNASLGVGAAWLALAVLGLFDTPCLVRSRPISTAVFGVLCGITMLLPVEKEYCTLLALDGDKVNSLSQKS